MFFTPVLLLPNVVICWRRGVAVAKYNDDAWNIARASLLYVKPSGRFICNSMLFRYQGRFPGLDQYRDGKTKGLPQWRTPTAHDFADWGSWEHETCQQTIPLPETSYLSSCQSIQVRLDLVPAQNSNVQGYRNGLWLTNSYIFRCLC